MTPFFIKYVLSKEIQFMNDCLTSANLRILFPVKSADDIDPCEFNTLGRTTAHIGCTSDAVVEDFKVSSAITVHIVLNPHWIPRRLAIPLIMTVARPNKMNSAGNSNTYNNKFQ